MIDGLKPYPAYKDSGVPWLGQVPAHWEVRRLRQVVLMLVSNVDKHTKEDEVAVRLCNYADVYKNERITADIKFMRATASPDEIKRFRVCRGDVAITKDSEIWNDIGVPALVEHEAPDLVYGYHLAILRPYRNQLIGLYLLRALQSQGVATQLHVAANGVTRFGLSHNAIKNVQIPLPPLSEQTAIIRFLDYVDRRIRRAIRAKQKLIKLLEEYKQALIHQAVTGKIDVRTGQPYPAYKDSGVEWLGQVPAHWEIIPLKWLAKSYRNGATPPTTKGSYYAGGTIPWYGPSSCNSGETVSAPVRFLTNAAIQDGVARLIHGPALLVVVIGATAGKMTLMPEDGTTNQQIMAFELPYDRYTCLFLLRQLRFSEAWLRETASTATISILNTGVVSHLPCLMPPPGERRAIIDHLDYLTERIDAAIAADRKATDLLQEFRTRLIADVVTGKLDVREVAARLPEEPSEEDAPWTDEEERAQDEILNGEGDHATISEEDG